MRALVVIGLGSLVAAACVPDFAYRDGADGSGGTGNADGDGGDRPSRGGGGGDGPGVVAVGVGPTAGPSVGPGPGPGPGSSTTGSTADTTTTGTGGQGDGGASTTTTTTTGGDATTTSTSGGGTLVDDGAPCWDGLFQEATSCVADQVCCYDADYYAYHTCDTEGFCGDWAYELQCNDAGDCDPGDLCCVNVDGGGYLESITCESSCDDLLACSALVPCPDGQTCRYVFNPESSHDEYDAYGYCDPG